VALVGLERDWVSWQKGRDPQFASLVQVLKGLAPPGEVFAPGPPRKLRLEEGRERPTLDTLAGNVHVAIASAGIRRILGLAYLLVWAWHSHIEAAKFLGKQPEKRIILLIDEPETHLHPAWQRRIIPSLMKVAELLSASSDTTTQLVFTTHAPLVLASLEPFFEEENDKLFLLDVQGGEARLRDFAWAKQGDATGWLLSDVFGLEQARSEEAESAIEAAEAFMRGDVGALPPKLKSQRSIHRELQRLLAADDVFWPRWIVTTTDLVDPARAKKNGHA
jgi:hypothetical protein